MIVTPFAQVSHIYFCLCFVVAWPVIPIYKKILSYKMSTERTEPLATKMTSEL